MDNRVVQSNSEDPIERIVNHAHWRGITLDDVEAVKELPDTGSTVIRMVKGMCCVDPNDIASDIERAYEWDKNRSQSGQSAVSFILLLFVAAVICALLYAGWNYVNAQPGYQQAVSDTAQQVGQQVDQQTDLGLVDNEHMYEHDEAREILDSCKSVGPYQTWKDRYEQHKYYYLCKLTGNNKFGIITFVVVEGTRYIKTAFSPADGTLNTVKDYLTMQGSRYTGPLK